MHGRSTFASTFDLEISIIDTVRVSESLIVYFVLQSTDNLQQFLLLLRNGNLQDPTVHTQTVPSLERVYKRRERQGQLGPHGL